MVHGHTWALHPRVLGAGSDCKVLTHLLAHYTLKPAPETRNPKPYALHPVAYTLHPKP